ncbi:FAD-dependent oxidoreductase [Pseudomonas syringae]|nr:FAD-dependent oxidoreductase [Pseudomonas syringae]
MTDHISVDVLICGAGAAGLALAIDLARRGISFRLIEKASAPFHGSRGKGIQPRTQEIFEDLGILDRITVAGGAYPPERRYHHNGSYTDASVMAENAPTPSEPYQQPLMIAQFLTERVMRQRLLELGHSPEFGCELAGFEQNESCVIARTVSEAGQETIKAQWLVGADGGRSFVRHALEIGFPGKTLGVRAVVADVVATGLSNDYWHRFNEGDMQNQISLCPLVGTEFFQIQGPIPIDGDIDLSAEGLMSLVRQRTGRTDIHIHSVSWASAYMMNARLADHYRSGRVFLIGDAAHIHPPTGGQGLNTSVQDAYNLGWKLASVINGASQILLKSYEEERRPVAAAMLGLATRLLDDQKKGEMRRGREVHQLDIGYPESTLALEHPKRANGLHAGDRAPDAPIRGSSGESTRLFNLFRGGHWTLLGYATDRQPVRQRPGLHIHFVGAKSGVLDEEGHFQNAYTPAIGDWVLIRPDGYVGAIVAAEHSEILETYLQQVGLGVLND